MDYFTEQQLRWHLKHTVANTYFIDIKSEHINLYVCVQLSQHCFGQ